MQRKDRLTLIEASLIKYCLTTKSKSLEYCKSLPLAMRFIFSRGYRYKQFPYHCLKRSPGWKNEEADAVTATRVSDVKNNCCLWDMTSALHYAFIHGQDAHTWAAHVAEMRMYRPFISAFENSLSSPVSIIDSVNLNLKKIIKVVYYWITESETR